MFNEIARKVEEIAVGTPPDEISGSTTVRAAVGLIVGKCLNNVEFSDRQAWEMLDEVQKEAVVYHRPKSKYAKWLAQEKADEERMTLELYKAGILPFVNSRRIVRHG